MAKLFKVSGYYLDPNGEYDADSLAVILGEQAADMPSHYIVVKEADIGEWDDNHPLNMCDCPVSECEKYFKEGYHG